MASYFATLTFDLANADSADYKKAEENLAAIGLKKTLAGNTGPVELPFNTYAGEFNGQNAAGVRDYVRSNAKDALGKLQRSGRLFVAVGGDWTWGSTGF